MSCTLTNTLKLPSGDSITFDAVLCGYLANLASELKEALPGELPEGDDFVSALTLNLLFDGELVEGVTFTVSFALPEGMEGDKFAVLSWDAETSSWVEVEGVTASGGFVTVNVGYSGTFVLVAR